ncbi:MAG: 2'-5' RNA ligase family protein [Rothia sp. (in: high G+C Gram-positive bacteria)]|nr:2'-5' RNA ligase family protein [Rothia sp. (in: high G+C Gram-positive bacteria)]
MRHSSPTLAGIETYWSVVAPIPGQLSQLILGWQKQQGVHHSELHSHITVLICRAPDNYSVLDRLEDALASQAPVDILLGEPQTFLPASSVSFLSVQIGAEELTDLHTRCQQLLGASASPFAYVPHLTLGMHLPEPALADSLQRFAALPKELRQFSLDRLLVYRYRGQNWTYLRQFMLAQPR